MMCKSSEKNTFVLWMCYGCVMDVLWNCVMEWYYGIALWLLVNGSCTINVWQHCGCFITLK